MQGTKYRQMTHYQKKIHCGNLHNPTDCFSGNLSTATDFSLHLYCNGLDTRTSAIIWQRYLPDIWTNSRLSGRDYAE